MFVYYELIKPQLYTRINSKSKFLANYKYIYTARRYASTVYAVVLCPSQAGIVSKWVNQRHTIAQGL